MSGVLLPAESLALTVGLRKVRDGEDVGPATAALCILALARIDGRFDYTEEPTDDHS